MSTNLENINPLVDLFQNQVYSFFKILNEVENEWYDEASESFRYEVTEHAQKMTKEYLLAVLELYERFSYLLEEANKLKNWNAGLGGGLSVFGLQMVIERGMSRLFFNRDDFRF